MNLSKHRKVLNHLSGNMFASTVFGSVFASFIAAVPWEEAGDDECDDETAEAALAVVLPDF